MRTITLENRIFLLCIRIILFITITSVNNLHAQCISTSAHSGTNLVNDGSSGNLSFLFPTNAIASDNSRASATAIATVLSGSTNYLKVTGFDFAIPNLSNICGVRVDVESRAFGLGIGAWIKDNEIRLVKGGTITGDNMVTSYADWSSTEGYKSYGGSSTTWNVSLTPADVNASNFGVVFSASFQGLALVLPSAQIDHIRMTIYYDPSLPTHLLSFTATARRNQTTLTWKTADEEDGEIIKVQRLDPGENNWKDIQRYDMHSGQNETYSFTERLAQAGDYSYRLEITNVNGLKTYSETRQVKIASASSITAYPNPTNDFLTIDGNITSPNVIISNPLFQTSKLRLVRGADGLYKLDVRGFSKGIYYVLLGAEKFSFVKL